MSHHFKTLAKDFFIYSGGNVLARLITFLLLPFTTSYLAPQDYGVISTLTLMNQLLNGLFTLGFAASFTRCYWGEEDLHKRESTVWAAFIALIINNCFWSFGAIFFSKSLSSLIFSTSSYANLFNYTFISMIMTYSMVPLLSYLRIAKKAYTIVSLNLLEIILSLGLTIGLIISKTLELESLVLIGLFSQTTIFILTICICLKLIRFKIGWGYLPQMLQHGIPYAFTLIGYFLLQSASRGVLNIYFSLEEVGLFYMGANFARFIELPLVSFINAWFPFYGSFVNKQEELIPIIKKIFSYYVLGMSFIIALFFASARPVVQLMLQPTFSSVWRVVGIMAFAQALWGVYNIFYVGMYFHKKFSWQLWTELSGGVVCIAFNFIFIPLFSKEGAAIATLFSFLVVCIIAYRINQHLFPIEFEWKRIAKILMGLGMIAIFSFLPLPLYSYIGLMGSAMICYTLFLWKWVLTPSEKTLLRNLLTRRLSSKSNIPAG